MRGKLRTVGYVALPFSESVWEKEQRVENACSVELRKEFVFFLLESFVLVRVPIDGPPPRIEGWLAFIFSSIIERGGRVFFVVLRLESKNNKSSVWRNVVLRFKWLHFMCGQVFSKTYLTTLLPINGEELIASLAARGLLSWLLTQFVWLGIFF